MHWRCMIDAVAWFVNHQAYEDDPSSIKAFLSEVTRIDKLLKVLRMLFIIQSKAPSIIA